MATGNIMSVFAPHGSTPPASNMATLDARNNHPVLNFDAATEETAYWEGFLPDSYGGGGLTVTIYWLGATATTGDVKWGSSIERLDTGTDQDADSFGTEQVGTTTTNATSGSPVSTAIAHTSGANMDSLVAGEMFRLRIARKAADGADTMAGDAQITRVVVKET